MPLTVLLSIKLFASTKLFMKKYVLLHLLLSTCFFPPPYSISLFYAAAQRKGRLPSLDAETITLPWKSSACSCCEKPFRLQIIKRDHTKTLIFLLCRANSVWTVVQQSKNAKKIFHWHSKGQISIESQLNFTLCHFLLCALMCNRG